VPPYNQFVECAPPDVCVYDLTSDPSEHVNLAKQEPAVLHKLMSRFQQLEQEYHPLKANPADDKVRSDECGEEL
jgi:hypothetical protein